MSQEKGVCPFYRYKVAFGSEVLWCAVTGDFMPVADSDSLMEVVKKVGESCLGFNYVNCRHYKKKAYDASVY